MAAEPFCLIKQNTELIANIHIETSEKCKTVLAFTAAETNNITELHFRHFKHEF